MAIHQKDSQVDCSAEISRMTTEPHHINYTTDEPSCSGARLLVMVERLEEAQMHTHLDVCAEMNKKRV